MKQRGFGCLTWLVAAVVLLGCQSQSQSTQQAETADSLAAPERPSAVGSAANNTPGVAQPQRTTTGPATVERPASSERPTSPESPASPERPAPSAAERPVIRGKLRIGMNGSLQDTALNPRVQKHLTKLGAVGVRLGPSSDVALESLHGLVLLGGADIDPARYGEKADPTVRKLSPERERFDFELAAVALKRKLPTLGICLGGQELWVLAGGKLVQDIPKVFGAQVNHRAKDQHHLVRLLPNTLLRRLYAEESIAVFSNHHQATTGRARGFSVSAESADGVMEAFESSHPDHFVIGVGWHPERSPRGGVLFEALVNAASEFREREASARTVEVGDREVPQ